jgi:hypothetical protein
MSLPLLNMNSAKAAKAINANTIFHIDIPNLIGWGQS